MVFIDRGRLDAERLVAVRLVDFDTTTDDDDDDDDDDDGGGTESGGLAKVDAINTVI